MKTIKITTVILGVLGVLVRTYLEGLMHGYKLRAYLTPTQPPRYRYHRQYQPQPYRKSTSHLVGKHIDTN